MKIGHVLLFLYLIFLRTLITIISKILFGKYYSISLFFQTYLVYSNIFNISNINFIKYLNVDIFNTFIFLIKFENNFKTEIGAY